ncbi:MAG: Multidrug resistance protein MdtC [Syntrophus sp. SKADARSKE-3]|nr:Multidrug resistance protein MdtC [Syntrophus sp. SKADARSKE-3]
MNIPAFFIKRPVATTLLTLGLAFAGIIAFQLLPVSPLPRVDFPTIMVQASLPGADPETMATSVAAPLERQLGHIAGVTEMTSASARGSCGIVMQFDLNRNIDGAARDVQAAINAARGYLPANLPNNPTYRKVNPSEAPILIIGLTSDIIDTAKIYDAASTILAQKLSQAKGVGQVLVGGGSLPAVRVELNPMSLNKYGINLSTVRNVLFATNVNLPKGQLADEKRTWEIQTNDQLRRANQYEPLVLAYRSGAAVRLSDVADVLDAVEDVRAMGLINGKPAVSIMIFRQPDANIIETVDEVRSLLPYLEAAMPGGVKLSVLMDRTPPIRGSLRDTEWTLVISVILVILVVFCFLRDVRSTLIPGVAVVVSLIGTFGAMYLLNYNLDNLSLMALTIATGFVVDDAIVVLENITRYIESGLSPLKAALKGAQEVAFTVLSMSCSLVAVFIPILLMGGMVGRLFREFAVTLSVAIFISLILSLTTTPMMCATLLRSENRKRHGALYRASERIFDSLKHGYEVTLRWALRYPRFMLTLIVAAIVMNIALFVYVPKGFFPEQDTGRLMGSIQADQDTSFQSMKVKLTEVVNIIRQDPDVEAVAAFTGSSTGTNTARMFITLAPFEKRKLTAPQVIARLRKKLAHIPGAPTYIQSAQELRVGGRMSGGLYQYTLQGENLAELNKWGALMLQKMRTLPQVVDVNSDQQNKGLQATVVIDRPTASRLGITAQMIDDVLYDAFGQRQVSITYTLLNQYHVVMEVEPRFWQHPDILREINVISPSGAAVPLSAFTHFEPTATSLAVNHQGQFPSITLAFNLAPGVALGQAVLAIEKAMREMGAPAGIRGSFQGTAQAFQASLANQPFLILAALVAVYIVLGVLYESYIHPITILSTLPSAGVGAILALMISGTDLSIIAIIGVILLIGIVKKNGIMMVDFALEMERREGKSPDEAIFQACLLRFRPIMMTTMAALLGALPLAMSMGIGSELRRPLGITIIGGLIISQILTLYTTPVMYLYLDRFRLWLNNRRKVGRKLIPTTALLLLMIAVSPFINGCAVGPDYVKPKSEIPVAFKEMKGWKVAEPSDHAIPQDWWTIFDDPVLNALEEQVSISNQNVAAAEAQYRQAMALIQINRASFFPVVTLAPAYTRGLTSGNTNRNTTLTSGGNQTVSDYLLPLNLSWELDVWGRIRRLVEASRAGAQASASDLAAIRLSAQSQLAQSYFQLRTLDGQKELLERTIAGYRKTLELTQNRYVSGVASRADVLQADTQLKTTLAQAIDIGVQRAQLEHAIALLCGKPASNFSLAATQTRLVQPVIPARIPSELLERRPDIAAAERRMAAANAQIGVATAAYYPTITLGASIGYKASDLSKLFDWSSRLWSLGPAASQNIFDGGLRRGQNAQARAAYDGAVASYRQTVLTGFQEVEDNLAALRILEKEAEAQDEAVKAARQSLELAVNQYKEGIVGYLNVITAQTVVLTNERTALDIHNRRIVASVLLVKALGGGWQQVDEQAKADTGMPKKP